MLRMKETHMQMNSTDASAKCPMCSNTGWTQTIRDGATFCRECSCGIRKRQIMQNRISFASIPESFRSVKLDNFNIDAYVKHESLKRIKIVVDAVRYWLFNLEQMKIDGMGLYFYSTTKGSGKTRMAASIANELIVEHGMHVKFATSMQIINEIKSTWDGHSKLRESELLNFLTSAEVLIIDDFGTEKFADWIGDRFYHIINERYVDKRITIITSNNRLEDLAYDSRIINRILERTYRIPFPEESVRESIAKRNMESLIKGMKGE